MKYFSLHCYGTSIFLLNFYRDSIFKLFGLFKKRAIISWTFKKFKSFEKYKFTSGGCEY